MDEIIASGGIKGIMGGNEQEITEEVATSEAPGAEGQEAESAAPQLTVEQLAEELARAQAQASEYLDNWRRTAAELSNARKRMLREQAEMNLAATARVMEKLLPIIDDVERAFQALPPEHANSEWVNGFRLIQHKLQALLESEGVTPIPAEGQMFDPLLHHAISHEVCEGFREGQIIAEAARGYKLGDRVLRPSMVRVAKDQDRES
jgi:molecular chaperone GrpE